MDNSNDNAIASLEVAKLVEHTIFWFEERMEVLNDIIEAKGTVVLSSDNGEESELNEEQSSAFRAGIATAISLIGAFPLSLDRPTDSIDLDHLKA